ncbi:hypothetical protein [Amycolatopsis sp. PS_44_ISF1]|uniref:hypothetical protein n=1 Tax=Amycolatopsis sp. PS_44_ISF1 TaxID=2974917 RepID=UPI0028E04BE2|nr:hypothetical protein [Amycolatopsis sp. PS_44_ISF1]MDT8915830.1 hypothetical protein [Amycolatopsis sp. PS_44_ISF1]
MIVEPITTRDYEARTDTDRAHPQLKQIKIQEPSEMLLYEELSRARIRQLEHEFAVQRPWRRARAEHRWSRVARWAADRAERYRDVR